MQAFVKCIVASYAAVIQTAVCLLGLTPQTPQERMASSRTTYRSPCRRRQSSFTPSLVLSPQSCALWGPLRCGCTFCERCQSKAGRICGKRFTSSIAGCDSHRHVRAPTVDKGPIAQSSRQSTDVWPYSLSFPPDSPSQYNFQMILCKK